MAQPAAVRVSVMTSNFLNPSDSASVLHKPTVHHQESLVYREQDCPQVTPNHMPAGTGAPLLPVNRLLPSPASQRLHPGQGPHVRKMALLDASGAEKTAKIAGEVAHVCHPSYLGDRDWEDYFIRPAWAESS
jgi:hypothetical protein